MLKEMNKARHLVNIGILAALLIATGILIFNAGTTGSTLEFRHYIGIVGTVWTLAAFFFSRNLFTLILGLVLLIGNFGGLSSFYPITNGALWFKPGSSRIALYWGQPEYTLLLLIYLAFNIGFYREVGTKKYWTNFSTRGDQLQPIGDEEESKDISQDNYFLEKVDSFKEKYKQMESQQLIYITKDKRYSLEAKQAALEVISERGNELPL